MCVQLCAPLIPQVNAMPGDDAVRQLTLVRYRHRGKTGTVGSRDFDERAEIDLGRCHRCRCFPSRQNRRASVLRMQWQCQPDQANTVPNFKKKSPPPQPLPEANQSLTRRFGICQGAPIAGRPSLKVVACREYN